MSMVIRAAALALKCAAGKRTAARGEGREEERHSGHIRGGCHAGWAYHTHSEEHRPSRDARITLALVSWQGALGKETTAGRVHRGLIYNLELRNVRHKGIYRGHQPSPGLHPLLLVADGSPKATDDGSLEKKTDMTVNLSSDRRVVNETISAQYLAAFQRYIETPVLLANV